MRAIVIAGLLTGALVVTQAYALPAVPSPVAIRGLAEADTIHCTPGKNHHFPTWNYQRDGCRRGPRKNGPRKKLRLPEANRVDAGSLNH